jgi:hypothetical protein
MSKKSTSRYDSSDRGVVAERILESKIDPTIKDAYEPQKNKKADEPETHSEDLKHREKPQSS